MNEKRLETLKRAAESGGPDQWYELGMYHALEDRNFDEALVWLKKGADEGHVKSMNKLWPLYQMLGKPLESMQVLHKLATEHKNPTAMIEMGLMSKAADAGVETAIELIDAAISTYDDISKISWQHKVQVGMLYIDLGRHNRAKLQMGVRLLEDVFENDYEYLKKYQNDERANEDLKMLLEMGKKQLADFNN